MTTTITYSDWRKLRFCLNLAKAYLITLCIFESFDLLPQMNLFFMATVIVIEVQVLEWICVPIKRFIKSCYLVMPYIPDNYEGSLAPRYNSSVISKGTAL